MSSKIIILADSLSELGGAEKTLKNYSDVLSGGCELVYLNTEELSPIHFSLYPNCMWIVGNFYWLIDRGLMEIFTDSISEYCVMNFDYLFCPMRNLEQYEHINKSQLPYTRYVKAVDEFLGNAQCLFFMSELQQAKYLNKLKLINDSRCVVLGSLISSTELDVIIKNQENKKSPLYCIYHQPTWQKGLKESIQFCDDNAIKYEVLPRLDYEKFIQKLSSYSGLVFLPNGGDTAPRLVIEAKLLGLDLVLSQNVEHKEEEWFKLGTPKSIVMHLNSLPDKFTKAIHHQDL